MDTTMIGTLLAGVVALLVSALCAALLPRAGAFGRRIAGACLPLGLACGLATLAASGAATTLSLILPGLTVIAALIEILGSLLGVHRFWRLLGSGMVLVGGMVAEWRRGDMFATQALLVGVTAVAAFAIIVFATRAGQRSGAPRTPSAVALLGAFVILVIAAGIPNPGLSSLTVVAAAAIIPALVWPPSDPDEHVLAPSLAAVAVAIGIYGWITNASPAMVLAPLAVIALDVIWTLVRRLATPSGRARLGAAGSRWRGADAWGVPADDLVVQRAAAATSGVEATAWLLGASAVASIVSLAAWRLTLPWVMAALAVGVVAAGWLVFQLALAGLSRGTTMAWLCGLTALGLLIAALTHLVDGRLIAVSVPLGALAAVWLASLGVWSRLPRTPSVASSSVA